MKHNALQLCGCVACVLLLSVAAMPLCAQQVMKNIKAILEEAGISMANVMKTTVFLSDMNNFAAMNEVYAEFFSEPFPARSAIAVKTLPKNALVEVECIAAK